MKDSKRTFLKTMGALGLGVSATALSACTQRSAEAASGIDPIDRVLSTSKLRAAYILYDVMFTRDPNTGKLGGLVYDIAQSAARNLGLEIEWVEEVYFGNAYEGLNSGRYDLVVANIWPTGARIRAADFCLPMFYSGLGAYVRPESLKRFKDVKDFNGPSVKISTIDGDISVFVIEERFSRAKIVSMPLNTDYSQMLLSVAAGKADVVFADTGVAKSFIKNNPGSLVEFMPGQPLQVFANCFAVNRKHARLKSVIDQSLAELLDRGTVDDAIARHEKLPGDCLRVAVHYREQRAY